MTTIPGWHQLPDNPYNAHAWIIGEPAIGTGSWIGSFCVIDGSGGLSIGDYCDISAGAQIYSHSTVRRCLSAGTQGVEQASTHIGSYCHIGAGAIILMGSLVEDHCVVAAGAIVTQFTHAPPYSLVIGAPARVIQGGATEILGSDDPRGNNG